MVRYVPLPYAIGNDYGPVPPWNDALDLLRDDRTLIWKNEPNARRTYLDVFSPVHSAQDRIALLRRFMPTVPAEFRGNHTWDVRINSDGYRGQETTTDHAPSTVRIACLGDSWTFGMPVGQDETYPSRLAAWLHQEQPDTQYEVQNFGVLGYSSFQGLQLLKSHVLDSHPNILVIGSQAILGSFGEDELPADATVSIEADIAFSDRVQTEDAEICERVQQGLGSRAYDKGRFSVRFEEGVYHFQNLLKNAYRTWRKR